MGDRDEQSASTAVIDRPGSTVRLVLLLAWPVLLQQFLIIAVDLSDFFLAGWFRPPDPSQHVAYQAAQTTAGYLAWLITCFTVFVTVGSTALVARLVGGRDRAGAVHATNQSITLAAVFGLLGTVAGLAGVERIVGLLGLKGEAAEFGASYLRPIFALLAFQVIEQAGIACLVGAGDTRTGLFIRGGVALVNLPLAWGLFHVTGFQGIALGTAISHTLGAVAVLLVLARGQAGLRLRLGQLRPDWGLQWRLLRVSLPAGADSMSVAVCQLWFLTLINALGNEAATAHGIALRWEALGYQSGAAFGTAAMALVGQNLGAGRPDRAARSGWVAFTLGLAVMTFMGAVFFSFAPQMFRLFAPNPEQEHVIVIGVPVLRLVAFAMPAVACTIVFTYALRGAGDTRVPVLFTWVGFLGVRIPLAYFLTQPLVHLGPWTWEGGLFGAWLAMFADLFVRGALLLARFASGRWQGVQV
ncbi:MAG TPA: MATE family efflux transporter [Gemmataceae bacterium]|nr:MATE family efflux transporter [Gemmataceae bacterium]